jgi:HSP20 family protein
MQEQSRTMANITRFDPFREMLTLRQAMDRLFDDSVVSPASLRTLAGTSLTPAVDLRETEDDLVLSVALPGAKPEDVNITITGQTLQIRGEFKDEQSTERDTYLYRERRFGSFSRQIDLPVRVNGDGATADFENGVLTLTIPKAEEVKPRQISIRPATKVDSNGGANA